MNPIKTQDEDTATEKTAERRPRVVEAIELPRVRAGVPGKSGVRAGINFGKVE
jgi:hypothetical protein